VRLLDAETPQLTITRRLAGTFPGLLAGVLIAVLGSTSSLHHTTSLFGVLASAAGYVVLTLAAAVITTTVTLWIVGFSLNRSAIELALRSALPALWLAPGLLLSHARWWFGVPMWLAAGVETSRLIAFVTSSSPPQSLTDEFPEYHLAFTLPAPRFAPWLDCTLAVYSFGAAIVLVLHSHKTTAALLFSITACLLIYRGIRALHDSPAWLGHNLLKRTAAVLTVAALLTAFSWLPQGDRWGWRFGLGSDTAGTSLYASKASGVSERKSAGRLPPGNATPIVGLVFSGVLLYPKAPSPMKLVLPRLATTTNGFPLVSPSEARWLIPFNGVYWLWQPPAEAPPATAAIRYEDPSIQTFRSLDGGPLWMEAHQNLGTFLPLDCCAAIQVLIQNGDRYPRTVDLELILTNTAVAGRPQQSLGSQQISLSRQNGTRRVRQTLTFFLPHAANLQRFDELKVRFRLKWWRGDQSARIGIAGFAFVPRT
jgi:hypothetical protein